MELLQRIANDMYVDDVEKQDFIDKYHKKNFGIIIPIKKDNTEKHLRMVKHCVK